jgi:deazaflavin-dependent oxidoreductase (nitroreductase family)
MAPNPGELGGTTQMAKTYRLNLGARLINAVFRLMTRLGVGASYRHILTVPGRKTGRLYSTPVDAINVAGDRWLVAGYGPASWVRNARAAGEVTLSRGGTSTRFGIEEATAQTATPVLRAYISEIKVTRSYFDADADSSDDLIAAELKRHAVFRLVPKD